MKNSVLVVTGGASGIGLACAKAMAFDFHAVALIDNDSASLRRAHDTLAAEGANTHSFHANVDDADSQIALANRIERDIGPVAALITSAGILHNKATVLDMDLDEHDQVWKTNYHGTLYSVRAFAPAMTKREAGTILTIGSINSFAPLPLPAYNPAKAAIMRLTEMLAVELGRYKIRVNGVAPTYVLTPALQAKIDSGDRDPKIMREAGAIASFVMPEQIASVAKFLCSDDASAITGAMIPVDNGWHAATLYRSYAGGMPWDGKSA